MKKKTVSIDYRKLIALKLKAKIGSFIVGLTTLLFIGSYLGIIAFAGFNRYFYRNKKINNKNAAVGKNPFPRQYTTKEGDSLWLIAEENYGSGYNAYDISVANKLSDPNNIPPRTKLILPPLTPKTPTKGEISAIQTGKTTDKQEVYIVKPGDSLSGIAFQVYGDLNAWPAIARANGLANPEAIEIGMTLIIPR